MNLHLGTTPWHWFDGASIARQAVRAEAMGFDSFWLPENHLQVPFAVPEPLMLLCAAAALTERIQLATTSYLLPVRSPLAAAEQIAVLDNLSEGRLLLGIGRGYDRDTLAAFGVPPGSRRALFSAHFEAVVALLCGDAVPACDAARRLSPALVQQPHPPMVVAAFGPKALAQAGSLGLPYLASPIESLTSLEQKYAQHRQACRAHGHPPPTMVPVMRRVLISDTPRVLDKAWALVRTGQDVRARPAEQTQQTSPEELVCMGSKQQVLEQIEAIRLRLGMTHFIASHTGLAGIDEAHLRASVQALADVRTSLS